MEGTCAWTQQDMFLPFLDYTSVDETIMLDLNLEQCVDIQVFEDNIVEGEETVELQVTSNDPAIEIVDPSRIIISIINTDGITSKPVYFK